MNSKYRYLAFFILGLSIFLVLQAISWIISRTDIFIYKNDKIVFFLSPPYLVIIFLAIIAFIVFSLFEIRKKGQNPFVIIALSLILGGGLSNLYERALLGGVFDYLDLYFWQMNIADIFIFAGIFIYLNLVLKNSKKSNF